MYMTDESIYNTMGLENRPMVIRVPREEFHEGFVGSIGYGGLASKV